MHHTLHVYGICAFFFNDTATTEIYPLSLHDALPICRPRMSPGKREARGHEQSRQEQRNADKVCANGIEAAEQSAGRSEEHTSELQSLRHLVCRLLLEKKK